MDVSRLLNGISYLPEEEDMTAATALEAAPARMTPANMRMVSRVVVLDVISWMVGGVVTR